MPTNKLNKDILLFMGVSLEPSNLCIITELMAKGSLYDVLRDLQVDLPLNVQVRMALDCLRGLQFIHSAGFIHRDLKYAFCFLSRQAIHTKIYRSPNLLVDKSWNIKVWKISYVPP
jgi:serine/threonine protein kinase